MHHLPEDGSTESYKGEELNFFSAAADRSLRGRSAILPCRTMSLLPEWLQ